MSFRDSFHVESREAGPVASGAAKDLKNVPKHVWYDEESHVATADVYLLQVAHAPIARRHRDVLELNVHVVLGYTVDTVYQLIVFNKEGRDSRAMKQGDSPSISLPR